MEEQGIQSELGKVLAQIREIHGSGDPRLWELVKSDIEHLHELVFGIAGCKP